MAEVEILSGLGVKGPACIRLTAGEQRWILDCGHGPDPDAFFNPDWLDGIDAVFITHDHIDHIGAAAHVAEAGVPIYTTQHTASALPRSADVRLLPEMGSIEINGVRLTTGRNGHALGGVWFHFDLGDGLFYSGDWSEESNWFAFDAPPKADTAIIDCSYHLDDIPQTQRITTLDALIDKLEGSILFPVPPSGRAGELALHLVERYGADEVRLDPECRAFITEAFANGSVSPKAELIKPLLTRDDMNKARFLICDTPNAEAGAAWGYVRDWSESGRLGRDAHVIFTGYMTAHARDIQMTGGGHFCRWNVHPPLSDQKAMVRRLATKRFAPVFCHRPEDYLKEEDFGAEVFLNGRAQL